MIGKIVTGCVAILSYHTATQDRGSECRDFGFISRIVTALIYMYIFIHVYLLNTFICKTNNIYIYTCKYFQNIYMQVCVFIDT